jgi:hypothetical protein
MRSPMVTTALRTESAPPNIQPDSAAYLESVRAALAKVLREIGPTLIEPRALDLARARRVLGLFVDTITGFALGVIAGHVLGGMRRWYGDEGARAMRGALPTWQRLATEGSVTEQLHVQFCHLQPLARALVGALPVLPMTAAMLDLLAKEDTIERRVGEELARGWRVYSAAVTTKRYPALTPLWQRWQWQLDGKPVLTRDEITQAGYIALVR